MVPDVKLAGPGVGDPARGAQSGTGVAESTGIVQSDPVITPGAHGKAQRELT